MKAVRDLAAAIGDRLSFERFKLMLHPANQRWFESQFENATGQPFYSTFMSIEVVYSEAVPQRDIEERWHPTEWGRFTDLEQSDDVWARKLGLGRVERIDHGPAIWKVNLPMFAFDYRYAFSYRTPSVIKYTC